MKKLKTATEVKGYNTLSLENQKLFKDFLDKYYSIYEYPEEHQPKSVKAEERYLRVNFKSYWLHVVDINTWY